MPGAWRLVDDAECNAAQLDVSQSSSMRQSVCACMTHGTRDCRGMPAYLALLGRVHGDGRIDEEVLKLQGLNEVRVPDHAAILCEHILKGLHALVDGCAALLLLL